MKKYKFTEKEERKIIDTNHSIDRYLLRYDAILSKEQIDNILKDVIKKIIINYDNKEGTYGFHSKSTGAGGIIDWRPDNKNLIDTQNHANIVSLFPIKQFHNFRPEDIKIIVEKQVILWAKENGFKLKESLKQENLCESYKMSDDHYVSFFEGKLYDFILDGYILVN